jgi:hypothetical protein
MVRRQVSQERQSTMTARPISVSPALFVSSIFTYATWLLVLQQASFILETFIYKELKQARIHAYDALMESRGKGPDFWIPYQEEWKEPPIERAQRSLERVPFLMKANNRWVRMAISKREIQEN